MNILFETRFGIVPLPVQVATLNQNQIDLLEKNLEEAFKFLTKDTPQEDLDPSKLVSVMAAATDRFLKKVNAGPSEKPVLLVPNYITKQ